MNQNQKIENIRHSLSHLLAAAILDTYPGTKLGIGPTIENGFYYDFLFPEDTSVSKEDLKKIEAKMRTYIKEGLPFSKEKISEEKAKEIFKNEKFKLDLINEYVQEGKKLSIYKTGDIFTDLCSGDHVKNTKEINPEAFQLTNIAGAYWRGDESNQMLTRIYGVAFQTKEELEKYLENLKKAKERDHRKLGKELGLFVFSDLVGPGLPIFTPKGKRILDAIKNYSRELRKEMGYQEVQTPQINKADLFKKSGHYEKYQNDMFEAHTHYTDNEYYIKPMNCPQHTRIYASKLRSYRDLPIRYADFAMLYRDEQPGELSGLTRLRSFSQDDGHSFCREDQIGEEFEKALTGVNKALETYGLDYFIRLSFWDESDKDSYLGDEKLWEKSQSKLKELVEEKNIDFEIEEGEAAFYGPKMDFIVKDSLGREWQISTIQLDINMPSRFELEYVDENGDRQTPIMIHSALVGSPERFFGILIEHYNGDFPTWLAPIQVKILPIAEDHFEYCENIKEKLEEVQVYVEIDKSDDSLGKKIRNAETNKIPYILVIGDNEIEANSVNVRERGKKDTEDMNIDGFLNKITSEIKERK